MMDKAPEIHNISINLPSELASALVKATAELTNIKTDAENPHYSSRYATLAGAIETIKPVLKKHGLTFIQDINGDAGVVRCSTIIIHESGQAVKVGEVAVPYDTQGKNAAQAAGSAITYARRYSLLAAFGLSSIDDDDDANAAAQPTGGSGASQQQASRHHSNEASQKQVSMLYALASKTANKYGLDDKEASDRLHAVAFQKYGKTSINELTKHEASQLIDEILKDDSILGW
jgi:hypothetical protein